MRNTRPVGVCCYALLEGVTGRRVGVEAVTTLIAAGVAAFAAGTAAAGVVVDRTGPAAGFLTAATIACLAGVLLINRRDTIDAPRARGGSRGRSQLGRRGRRATSRVPGGGRPGR